MVYSFQTLYVNVDNTIIRGGKHAIRYQAILGLTWSNLHLPYAMCLILLATGLGFMLRDIVIPPTSASTVARVLTEVVHATTEAATTSGPSFIRSRRWLFSAGWGGALICSALLTWMHKSSPRDATRRTRLIIRCIVATALMVGMPFSGVTAKNYLIIHAVVSAVIGLYEYILVHVDYLGFFRPDVALTSTGGVSDPDLDYLTDSSEMDTGEDDEKPRAPDGIRNSTEDLEGGRGKGSHCPKPALAALKRRLHPRSRHRMEEVNICDRRKYDECGLVHT